MEDILYSTYSGDININMQARCKKTGVIWLLVKTVGNENKTLKEGEL